MPTMTKLGATLFLALFAIMAGLLAAKAEYFQTQALASNEKLFGKNSRQYRLAFWFIGGPMYRYGLRIGGTIIAIFAAGLFVAFIASH